MTPWVFLYWTEKGWNTSGVSRRSTLSVSKTPWCCTLYRDRELNEGRCASEYIQMCQRLHFSRILSFTPEPFHFRYVFVTRTYVNKEHEVSLCVYLTLPKTFASVYRDKCKQSELSDLFAGGSTQVEPGLEGCFPVIGAISFTQLHRRTCSLCKQQL